MLVAVLNQHNKPIMPCSQAKARKLLSEKKAKVVRRSPFTIKLLYGSSGYVQITKMGVDIGSRTIGVSVTANGETLYVSEVKTRGDEIRSNLERKKMYRRSRRGRKTGYRKPRWRNRKRKEGWLTPTMGSKIQSHVREIEFVKKILPISSITLEIASFDIHKIVNPTVFGSDYQKGLKKDFYNTKAYVLYRDEYICQKCKGKKKDKKLHVHHIVFRSHQGSDAPNNLIVLCKTCHNALHESPSAEKDSLNLRKKITKNTKGATQTSTISVYLKKIYTEAYITYGYETKFKREQLGYPKSHCLDATVVTLSEGECIHPPFTFYKKVNISRGDYKQTFGGYSEKRLLTGKIQGFRKFDKVLWNKKEYFIQGKMSTGYAKLMDIDQNPIPLKPMPKFSKMNRVSARKSCLISQIPIENIH